MEEPDERKELDPEIWDKPGELDERGEDDENDGLSFSCCRLYSLQ